MKKESADILPPRSRNYLPTSPIFRTSPLMHSILRSPLGDPHNAHPYRLPLLPHHVPNQSRPTTVRHDVGFKLAYRWNAVKSSNVEVHIVANFHSKVSSGYQVRKCLPFGRCSSQRWTGGRRGTYIVHLNGDMNCGNPWWLGNDKRWLSKAATLGVREDAATFVACFQRRLSLLQNINNQMIPPTASITIITVHSDDS